MFENKEGLLGHGGGIPRWSLGFDAFGPGPSLPHQSFGQIFCVYLDKAVITRLPTLAPGMGPTSPDDEGALQSLPHHSGRLMSSPQNLVDGNAEMFALFLHPLRVSELGFRGIDEIEAGDKGLLSALEVKAVAVVVLVFDITTVPEFDPGALRRQQRLGVQPRDEQDHPGWKTGRTLCGQIHNGLGTTGDGECCRKALVSG